MDPRLLSPERRYADRIDLLALVAARHPYPPGWSDQRAGILLQTKWQDRSGRAICGDDGRLESWWPVANWTLTVWQLEALQTRGELSEVRLAEHPLPLPDEVRDAILAYYDRLDAVDASEVGAAHELQRLLWNFHVRAIERGLAASAPLLAALPAAEARFAEAWGHGMVGLLAAVNFPTEFETVRGMQRLLPARLLQDADWSTGGDLLDSQRSTIVAMRALYEAVRSDGGALERQLTSAAVTPAGARVAANQLFEALAFGGANAAELLRAKLATAS